MQRLYFFEGHKDAPAGRLYFIGIHRSAPPARTYETLHGNITLFLRKIAWLLGRDVAMQRLLISF